MPTKNPSSTQIELIRTNTIGDLEVVSKSVDVDDGGFPDSKANAMAFKMKAAAAFAAAGLRSEARRTGTSLAREGTGMHATLSRIRSDKGRVKHKKFLQSMESGILVRPSDNFRDKYFLFSEDDRFKKVWTVLILGLVVFTSILIPIQFGFPEGVDDSPGLDYTIDFLFICDLFICFRTAYVNKAGDEVFDTKLITQNYLRNWFAIDLIACFPGEVFVLITQSQDTKSKILLRLLKMPRLLRIGRLFKYLDKSKFVAFWRVGKLVLMLMFVSHWIACLYNMICRLEFESNMSGIWEPFLEMATEEFSQQYMFALFTAFSVLIGEGIDPSTIEEQAFIFVSMLLGAILMAVIIGNISLVLQNGNALSAMYRNKMDMINDAMRAMDISPRLQAKTVAYYELLWTRQRALSTKESFIDELSPCLRKEINLDLNTEVIYRCELFKRLLDRDIDNNLSEMMSEDTSDHVLVAIVNALEREVFLPGDTIIQQGEIGGEMFFLVRGLISVEKMALDEATKEWKDIQIANLKAGSYFGELALLRKGSDRSKQRRAASCIALSDCDTRILRKTTFNTVCEDFPELRTYLQSEADRKYAAFAKPKAKEDSSSKIESKKNSDSSPSLTQQNAAIQKQRVNSIVMALSQPNVQVGSGATTAWGPNASSPNSTLLHPEASLSTLQSTLDSINLRMSRLEVNMGRLQAKGGVHDHLDLKPPSTSNSTGSNARKYMTSPTNKGWATIKNIVRPESVAIDSNIRDDEDNKSNSSSRGGSENKKRNASRTGSRISRSPGLISNSRWGNIQPGTPSTQDTSEDRRRREEEKHAKSLSNRRW